MAYQKRKISDMEAHDRDGSFPDHTPFNLNDAGIETAVRDLCDLVLKRLVKHAIGNEKIERLIVAAKNAKFLPRLEQLNLAVLGEQGVGKSSLVNALLDRKLLDRSGGRKACTAFATIIEYLDGADDDAKMSNIKIRFQDFETIKANIREQIELWTEAYPSTRNSGYGRDDEDNAANSGSKEDEVQIKDEPMSDAWLEEPATQDDMNAPSSLQRAAETAKDFFTVIFDTANDPAKQAWLQERMNTTNIAETDFLANCCRQVETQLGRIRKTLGMQEDSFEYEEMNVADRKLGDKISIAQSIWPFVKEVNIATGHVLLRFGIRFFDVPGYGDSSNLRRAVINEFRWKADVEMIVVRASRLQTSTIQQEYIDLSLRFEKRDNPILVLNKIDELINEDDVVHNIKKIRVDPFVTLYQRFLEIEQTLEDDPDDEEALGEQAELEDQAIEAFITHEVNVVKHDMKAKNIEVFGTSAALWTSYLNQRRRTDPRISREMTGVQQLRHHLLSLTADTNLKMYHNHVFKTLADVRRRADRIQAQFVEDKSYAAMREDLKRQIPALTESLGMKTLFQMRPLVKSPWSKAQQLQIISAINKYIDRSWVQSRIGYSSFRKMLKENGIPVNGKCRGTNLNQELLSKLKPYVDQWRDNMAPEVQQLSTLFLRPVQDLFDEIHGSIQKSSAMRDLKDSALSALEETIQDLNVAGTIFREKLRNGIRDTHLRFTTEIDVTCPVATAMKPAYERSVDPNVVGAGKGAYIRQRTTLCETIQNPPEDVPSMLNSFANALVYRHKSIWADVCTDFIDRVTRILHRFSDICEELLQDATRTTKQHKKACAEISEVFKVFDVKWNELKSMFKDDEERPQKKCKQNMSEDNRQDAAATVNLAGLALRSPVNGDTG